LEYRLSITKKHMAAEAAETEMKGFVRQDKNVERKPVISRDLNCEATKQAKKTARSEHPDQDIRGFHDGLGERRA